MPGSFRIGQAIISLQILCVLFVETIYPVCISHQVNFDARVYSYLFFCLITLIGLLRRLVCGWVLSSCFGVVAAFCASAMLIPDIDCPTDEFCRNPLLHIIGYEPSILFSWVVIVLVALFFLIPQIIIGRHKKYFIRKAW